MTDQTIAFLWPEADFRASGVTMPDGFAMRFGRGAIRAEAIATCAGADYICIGSGFGAADKELLDLAPSLRLVQLTGAGYNNVDHPECARRAIPVCYCPGLNAPSVAQTVVQLALRLIRPLPLLQTGGEAEWLAARKAHAATAHEVGGRVGIVGYGHIGKHVAKLFQGLGLEVAAASWLWKVANSHQTRFTIAVGVRIEISVRHLSIWTTDGFALVRTIATTVADPKGVNHR